MDNSTAVTYRNLPDLKKAQNELAKWSTAGKCESLMFRGNRRRYVRVRGKAYLLYQTDPECRALLQSSQLRRSYQTPETDTHLVISVVMISVEMTQPFPARPQTHRRNIFRRKLVRGVWDEQAGFTHSTVTNDNTLDGLHGCVSRSSLLIQYLKHKRPNVTGCGIAKTVKWSSMTICAVYMCVVQWQNHVSLLVN